MNGIQYMQGSFLLIILFNKLETHFQDPWLHIEEQHTMALLLTGTGQNLREHVPRAQMLLMGKKPGWNEYIWAISMATVESRDYSYMSYYSQQQW